MKLLVISDTHRNLSKVYRVINDIQKHIDGVIHCGDITDDVDILKSQYKDIQFYNVRGNCDYYSGVPDEQIFVIGGKKIFATHGHNYGVNYNIDRLCYRAMEIGADVCLYGHTHIPLIENYNGIVILNPGSLSAPRGGSKPSYGIITIEGESVRGSIIEYK